MELLDMLQQMNDEKKESMPLNILGREIGTYTGWDQADTFTIQVYDFVPAAGVNIPDCECVTFSLETGLGTWYNGDDGTIENKFDIIKVIGQLPLDKEYADQIK
jgi:hypothetical protein